MLNDYEIKEFLAKSRINKVIEIGKTNDPRLLMSMWDALYKIDDYEYVPLLAIATSEHLNGKQQLSLIKKLHSKWQGSGANNRKARDNIATKLAEYFKHESNADRSVLEYFMFKMLPEDGNMSAHYITYSSPELDDELWDKLSRTPKGQFAVASHFLFLNIKGAMGNRADGTLNMIDRDLAVKFLIVFIKGMGWSTHELSSDILTKLSDKDVVGRFTLSQCSTFRRITNDFSAPETSASVIANLRKYVNDRMIENIDHANLR